MSAIYGAVYKAGKADEAAANKMQQGYSKCKIDKHEHILFQNVMMGCAHVFATKESANDILPLEDEDYIYTADVIIDNRTQLASELDVNEELSDGALLFLAFKKWKEKMCDHLIGIFSACFYDKKTEDLWLFTDHTSSRCVNYYVSKEGFFFSTMITPILNVVKDKIGISEKFIAYCESNCSADLLFEAELTAFDGVYQLEAGHYIHYHDGIVEKKRYFDPMSLYKKLRITEEDGFKLFRDTFSKCVEELLRANGEVGITLSSGLDSSSVACVAAPLLEKRGHKLYSYTSIPIEGYTNDDDFLVANEENGVRKMCQSVSNIEMEFVNCPDKNAFTDLKQLVPILECPYKSGVNLVWIDYIYNQARNKNVRIILKGQYGNSTISYGTLMTTVFQLFLSGHWIKCINEINSFGARNHIARKDILKVIKQAYDDNRKSKPIELNDAFTKEELLKKYCVIAEIEKIDHKEANTWIDTQKERFNSMWSPRILAHLGAFDTKLGLKEGIVVRDPTKDIRILQLCMNLPITCFGGGGLERRLVREGMEGIVPKNIRLDTRHRGWQGADLEYRLSKAWDDIKDDVMSYLDKDILSDYVDINKVKELKEILCKDGVDSEKEPRTCVKMLVIAALSEFLYEFKEK